MALSHMAEFEPAPVGDAGRAEILGGPTLQAGCFRQRTRSPAGAPQCPGSSQPAGSYSRCLGTPNLSCLAIVSA